MVLLVQPLETIKPLDNQRYTKDVTEIDQSNILGDNVTLDLRFQLDHRRHHLSFVT